MMVLADRLCEAEDCDRQAHPRERFCAGHAKQLRRHGKTAPLRERLTLRDRVMHLINGIADADSEDDKAFERAWDALEHALTEWADAIRTKKAGRARMASMTPEQRSDFARMGARARWATSALASDPKGKRRGGGEE